MMLAAPIPPLPEGTPPPQHKEHFGNGVTSKADLFLYKTRDCKSAPEKRTNGVSVVDKSKSSSSSSSSSDSESSSSSTSSSYSSVTTPGAPPNDKNHNSTRAQAAITSKRKKSAKNEKKPCCCCCRCFPSFSCSCSSISGFFFGRAPKFTTWATSYASTSRLKYLSLFFFESSLRSIADIQFCSNPWSGLIILIAMLLSSPMVTFLAIVTLTVGIETAVVFLHVPMEDIRSGVVTFNNFLAGTVIALVAQPDVILAHPDIIAICMAIGVLTVVIWKGLNGLLAEKLEFPLLNAPFHLIMLLYLYSGVASRFEAVHTHHPHDSMQVQGTEDLLGNNDSSSATTAYPSPGMTLTYVEPLNWIKIFFGVILAPSQVFGTAGVLTSGMVHLAMFIYSPIMLMQSLMGSAIGTLMGICLSNPEDYEYLYNGSWGYNPLFTAAGIGGFFVVFNFHSWLLSFIGAVLTTLLYSAMKKCHVPPLGIPFMLITWLLLPSIPTFDKISDNTGKGNDIPIQPDATVIDMQLDYLREGEDDDKLKKNVPDIPAPSHFIRLRLSQVGTPEENRNNYLPKKPPQQQIKRGRRGSKRKKQGDGEDEGRGTANGTMNKYRTSTAEIRSQQPHQLVLAGQNSILPL